MIQYPIIDTKILSQNDIVISGNFKLPAKKGWVFILLRRSSPKSQFVSIFDGLGVAIHPLKLNVDEENVVEPNVCIIESFAPRKRLELRKIFKEADKLFESEIFNTLGSATINIISEVWYSFKIFVSLRNVIRVKIWPFGTLEPSDNDLEHNCVSVPYPTPAVSGDYFGIGVYPADNEEYLFSDLKIEKSGFQKNYILFDFDASDLGEKEVILNCEAAARGISINGVEIYVFDQKNQKWEYLTKNETSFEEEKTKWRIWHKFFLKNDHIENGRLYFLLSPRDYYPIAPEYGIQVNYCRLISGPTKYSKVFGMADVYCLTEEVLTEKVVPADQNNGIITIKKPDKVPFSRISHIEVELPQGRQVIPQGDYYLKTETPNERWSSREQIQIILKDIYKDLTVHVFYYYFENIMAYQDIIENDERKIGFSDVLLFHYIPYYVEISLEYQGNINSFELEELLANYIKNQRILSLSSIIDFCYNNGVSYINMDTLDIKIHHWTREFVYKTEKLTSIFYFKKNERPLLLKPANIRKI